MANMLHLCACLYFLARDILHAREPSFALTRIRTWVIAVTTYATNHSITANGAWAVGFVPFSAGA